MKNLIVRIMMILLATALFSCQQEQDNSSSKPLSDADFSDISRFLNSYIENKNNLLVGKNMPQAEQQFMASFRQPEMAARYKKEILDERKRVRACFDKYRTENSIRRERINKVGDKYMVYLTELTRLNYIGDDEPFRAGVQDFYLFTLQKNRQDQWQIVDIKMLNTPGATPPEPGVAPIPESIQPTPQDRDLEIKDPKKFERSQWQVPGYNGQAAANYARQYAYNRNSDYVDYGYKDCTNFVSQAVYAGGWPMTGSSAARADAWFYTSRAVHSSSWAGAHAFRRFIEQSGRGTNARSFGEASVGDVISVDFDKNGTIDHNIIVTGKNGSQLLISAHSNNRLNYPLQNYLNQGFYLYLWKL